MKTKELITILERELGTVKSRNVIDIVRDEIIQRLREYNELKKLIYDCIDPIQDMFSFLISVYQPEDDIEGGSFRSIGETVH